MQKTYQHLGIAIAIAICIALAPKWIAALQSSTEFWYFAIFLLVTAAFTVCLSMYQNMKRINTRRA